MTSRNPSCSSTLVRNCDVIVIRETLVDLERASIFKPLMSASLSKLSQDELSLKNLVQRPGPYLARLDSCYNLIKGIPPVEIVPRVTTYNKRLTPFCSLRVQEPDSRSQNLIVHGSAFTRVGVFRYSPSNCSSTKVSSGSQTAGQLNKMSGFRSLS